MHAARGFRGMVAVGPRLPQEGLQPQMNADERGRALDQSRDPVSSASIRGFKTDSSLLRHLGGLETMRTLLAALTMCLLALPANARYSGGTGEPNDPYQIATAADLIALGETPADYGKHFLLTADLDLDPNLPGRKVFDRAVIAPASAVLNYPIGEGTVFWGSFDGDGHKISHLIITGKGYLGLFGQSGGTVRNLAVVDVELSGSGFFVGGLVGCILGGDVSQCYSTGTITGDSSVGGLVGVNCGHVINCYSTSTVSGNNAVGGLVGSNGTGWYYGTIRGRVDQGYSTGSVSGTSYVGGLVGGAVDPYDVTGCFWDVESSRQSTSDAGTGKTTAEMQNIQTYRDAGWDFVGEIENGTHEVWQMPEKGGYPVLGTFNGHTPVELRGMGTPEDPYLISDALELGAIIHYRPHAHYRLSASIDLSNIRWTTAVIPQFEGTFDGAGHAIRNLHICGRSYLGLFGQLGSTTKVSNLGLEAVDVNGTGDCIGGLAGRNDGSSIVRCYSIGTVAGNEDVGGLLGRNYGTITDCNSASTVTGSGDHIGGLVGNNYYGTVSRCHSTGSVSGNSEVGGLAGYSNEGTVIQCYSTSVVSGAGQYSAGGLVGKNLNYYFGTVSQCYSTGPVKLSTR